MARSPRKQLPKARTEISFFSLERVRFGLLITAHSYLSSLAGCDTRLVTFKRFFLHFAKGGGSKGVMQKTPPILLSNIFVSNLLLFVAVTQTKVCDPENTLNPLSDAQVYKCSFVHAL